MDKANAYFNALLKSGLMRKKLPGLHLPWQPILMVRVRIMNYQNTAWNWYSSMVLKQQDGTFNLTR